MSTDSGNAPGEAWEEMLLVGVVARPQGIRGEVVVNATTDFVDDRFGEGAVLYGRRPPDGPVERLTVTRFRVHLGRPAVVFAGVASMNDAGRFAGWELKVPAASARQLPPHVYYHHELVGCAVRTVGGDEVGTVTAIEGEGDTVRLVVTSAAGPVLVPLTQAFCEVDLAERRITLDPPEGLLEVNGGWRG